MDRKCGEVAECKTIMLHLPCPAITVCFGVDASVLINRDRLLASVQCDLDDQMYHG